MTGQAAAIRRRMIHTGLVQGLLLAPSLALSVIGLAFMTVGEYAAWALLFALGSGSIILDFGAFQLAQIQRAEGKVSRREAVRLFGQASISPVLLTVTTSVFWRPFLDVFVDHERVASPLLPLLLGAAATIRAWQNVANGFALGAGDEGVRRRAAIGGAAAVMVGIALIAAMPAEYGLSSAYLLGGVVGLVMLMPLIAQSIGVPPPRGPSHIGARATIGALGVSLTQIDRLLVGVLMPASGLAAYDFAARLVSTVKLGCVLVATGAAAQAAGATTRGSAEEYLRTAQRFLDRLSLVAFLVAPVVVAALTLVAKPEIAGTATAVAAILSVGHGLNATTATITGYLSGLRRPHPEVMYLVISVALLAATAWPLGTIAGTLGVAAAVTLSLGVGSLWIRRYGLRNTV